MHTIKRVRTPSDDGAGQPPRLQERYWSDYYVDYVATGDEITTQWLKSGSPLLEAIEQIHGFFPQSLWKGDVELTPHQAMLSMNAFMLYMSAVRVSLSGHVAATFPLFRTALESACYAYVIGEDRSLETVWVDRHRGDEQRKLCRRKLSTAVSDAAVTRSRRLDQRGLRFSY